ncbi:MAG: quinolinate synthase NadA [Deltaproteobacteria bacterium]|jgi:quinolinate synthase|nr:quinolinate synthase NadA [Deltaproteobacteria bacterium]
MVTVDILPDKYKEMTDDELRGIIESKKSEFGSRLCILGHYYQQDAIIDFADHQGDSFQLAKTGSEIDAEYIVFCGVHFMAESSVVLGKEGQRVFLPDMDAGCPLADFATIDQVKVAWNELNNLGLAGKFIPITYMNSSAAMKAFCGENGGTVCTSSSAARAFDWAFNQNKRIFFFPDENLGKNTALSHDVSSEDIVTWDPYKKHGGLDDVALEKARVIVWKGYCHVHTLFTVEHVEDVREEHQGCQVVVHPECTPEVVALADGNGSTAFLKNYVEDAKEGSTIIVGTEINMVARLAKQNLEKRILPLARSLCPNMFKISTADLAWTLDKLGEVNEVFVDPEIAKGARVALNRMLSI